MKGIYYYKLLQSNQTDEFRALSAVIHLSGKFEKKFTGYKSFCNITMLSYMWQKGQRTLYIHWAGKFPFMRLIHRILLHRIITC